jgi:hypothetical protein
VISAGKRLRSFVRVLEALKSYARTAGRLTKMKILKSGFDDGYHRRGVE